MNGLGRHANFGDGRQNILVEKVYRLALACDFSALLRRIVFIGQAGEAPRSSFSSDGGPIPEARSPASLMAFARPQPAPVIGWPAAPAAY